MNPKKCRTRFCRGRASKSGHSPYCSRCRSRRWKEKFPGHYAFKNLRVRAKQRGHDFTLMRLWKNGLAANHGKTASSLSVNRKNNALGYHDDNVELLTLSENSRRQYVPYFKNKEQEQFAIAEAGAAVRAAYPEA